MIDGERNELASCEDIEWSSSPSRRRDLCRCSLIGSNDLKVFSPVREPMCGFDAEWLSDDELRCGGGGLR